MNKTNENKLVKRLVETKAETIKLGIDQHARDVMVSAQADGAIPLRAQRMSAAQLAYVVEALRKAGCKVYACYEAGPCGFGLYRALTKAGATCYVVVPKTLSDGRRQKTDGLDAVALTDQLDRYVRGNRRAFTVVQVPAEEAERWRAHKRVRDQLQKSVQQWAARGKSLLLVQGYHVTGVWWKERAWSRLAPTLPAWLVPLLETIRTALATLWAQEQKYRTELAAQAPQDLPKAVGALTWVTLSREICDWHRFKNRRQVSSYTGLCPGVQQSGGSKRDGSINRHGNPRVRHLLIELVWRLARWQPDYPPVRKLVEGIVRGAARRKLAVAAARKLAVDLWRLATHQTSAQKLKLSVPSLNLS